MEAILKIAQTGSPSQLFLMASTFDIGEGPRSKKTWSQSVLGGAQ